MAWTDAARAASAAVRRAHAKGKVARVPRGRNYNILLSMKSGRMPVRYAGIHASDEAEAVFNAWTKAGGAGGWPRVNRKSPGNWMVSNERGFARAQILGSSRRRR